MAAPIKKLALVGPLPPPYGGMANQTKQLVQRLREDGIDVEIVQSNRAYWPSWIGKIPVIRAGFRLLPYLATLWQVTGRTPLIHIMANSGWSWHLFAAPAVWIASMRGCKVILNYRGGEAEAFFSRSFKWVSPTLNRCHQIIVPSLFLQKVFYRFGETAVVVPNPVDLGRFSFRHQRKQEAWPNLIICRNLEPIYGIPTALRAFALILQRYPTARLWIAGSGPQKGELEALAKQLGVAEKVVFTGRLPPERIVELYQQADILLNPSEVDNAPNCLLEAMAAGVPIVSTDAGGVTYLVEHEKTALLVSTGEFEAMAAAVLRILSEPALQESLKKQGMQYVQNHDWEVIREKLFNCYRAVL